ILISRPHPDLPPFPTRRSSDLPPPTDIWDRIRDGFKLEATDHGRVVTARSWYQRHQDYLDRVATRAQPYLHYIVEEIERRDMPRSEEHTSELQSRENLVCRLLL